LRNARQIEFREIVQGKVAWALVQVVGGVQRVATRRLNESHGRMGRELGSSSSTLLTAKKIWVRVKRCV